MVNKPVPLKELLTKEQIVERWHLPSVRMLEGMMRRRKVPYHKLGYRTVRFDPAAVEAALSRLEIKEIGRPR